MLAVGLSASMGAIDGLRKGLVRWRAALLMAGLGVAVSPVGVGIARLLQPQVLMTLFAVAMFVAAGRLLRLPDDGGNAAGSEGVDKNCMLDPGTGRLRWNRRCAATLAPVGATSGLLTGMLGIGGGFVLVPACRQWTAIGVHGIVATSLMVVALVSLGASITATLGGVNLTATGLCFVGAAMGGLVMGRRLSPALPARTLRLSFAVLSICVPLYLPRSSARCTAGTCSCGVAPRLTYFAIRFLSVRLQARRRSRVVPVTF